MHGGKCERMEQTYGNKSPIALASGVRPDQRWAIAVSNCSGAQGDEHGYYLNPHTFDLAIMHEELKDKPKVEFDVYRSNESMRNEHEGSLLMENGIIRLTVAPFDLVTLVSKPGSVVLARQASASAAHTKNESVCVAVFDVRGRQIADAVRMHTPVRPADHSSNLRGAHGIRLARTATTDGIRLQKRIEKK